MVRLFRRRGDRDRDDNDDSDGSDGNAERDDTELDAAYEGATRAARRGVLGRLQGLLRGAAVDDDFWDELEETLILADLGGVAWVRLIEQLRGSVGRRADGAAVRSLLRERLIELLEAPSGSGALWPPNGAAPPFPHVILVVGVNGAGKTTSIAKLAYALRGEGRSVLLAAADTYRAAAIEQLQAWSERLGVECVAHQLGADPGAVAYDAIEAAGSRGLDVVIIDTAGRLQTQSNLMAELGKIRRVIGSRCPGAPHEVLLVLDATSGQNGLSQASRFAEAAGVTAICLAKLDGTSKGGIVFAIADQFGIPVRFAGTGEQLGDIAPFEPARFVDALLSGD